MRLSVTEILLLSAPVALVVYPLAGAVATWGAKQRCEARLRESDIVLKVSVDALNFSKRTCVYADAQGLVHKVEGY